MLTPKNKVEIEKAERKLQDLKNINNNFKKLYYLRTIIAKLLLSVTYCFIFGSQVTQ